MTKSTTSTPAATTTATPGIIPIGLGMAVKAPKAPRKAKGRVAKQVAAEAAVPQQPTPLEVAAQEARYCPDTPAEEAQATTGGEPLCAHCGEYTAQHSGPDGARLCTPCADLAYEAAPVNPPTVVAADGTLTPAELAEHHAEYQAGLEADVADDAAANATIPTPAGVEVTCVNPDTQPITLDATHPSTAGLLVQAAAIGHRAGPRQGGEWVTLEGTPEARLAVLVEAVFLAAEGDVARMSAAVGDVAWVVVGCDACHLADGVDDRLDAVGNVAAAWSAFGDADDAAEAAVAHLTAVAAEAAKAEALPLLDQTRLKQAADAAAEVTATTRLAAGRAKVVAVYVEAEAEDRVRLARRGEVLMGHLDDYAVVHGVAKRSEGLRLAMAAVTVATGVDYMADAGRAMDIAAACRVWQWDLVTALPTTAQKGLAALVDHDTDSGMVVYHCRPGIEGHVERLLAHCLSPAMAKRANLPAHIAEALPRCKSKGRGVRSLPGSTGGDMVEAGAMAKQCSALLAYAKAMAKAAASGGTLPTDPWDVPVEEAKATPTPGAVSLSSVTPNGKPVVNPSVAAEAAKAIAATLAAGTATAEAAAKDAAKAEAEAAAGLADAEAKAAAALAEAKAAEGQAEEAAKAALAEAAKVAAVKAAAEADAAAKVKAEADAKATAAAAAEAAVKAAAVKAAAEADALEGEEADAEEGDDDDTLARREQAKGGVPVITLPADPANGALAITSALLDRCLSPDATLFCMGQAAGWTRHMLYTILDGMVAGSGDPAAVVKAMIGKCERLAKDLAAGVKPTRPEETPAK